MLNSKKIIFLLVLIIGFHALLLSKLVFLPTPELFIYPYLTNNGLVPYQQILDQHFPGLMFLPLNFDNLGMNNEVIARVWLVVIVAISQLLIFFVSREIFKSDKKALIVNFLYLAWQPFFEGWVLWLDTFLPIFLLFSLLYINKFLSKRTYVNIFLAGIFLGVGVIFKQVLVPISLLLISYIYFRERKFKTVLIFFSGFLPPLIIMLIFLWNSGVIADFWFWTVTFNLTTFAQDGRKIAPFSQLARVLFVSVFALGAIFPRGRKLVALLFIFIIFPIVEIYNRFDFVHFQPALPFVLIATVLGFTKKYTGNIWKFPINNFKNLFILIYILIALRWIVIFYGSHISDHIFFFDKHTKEVAAKIMQYSHIREKIFIFGETPLLYQMSQTLPAGDIFVFQFPWFLKVSQERILEGIMRDKPEIIISDRTVIIEGAKIIDFASDIDQYIGKNYQKIDSVGATDILRRKSQI